MQPALSSFISEKDEILTCTLNFTLNFVLFSIHRIGAQQGDVLSQCNLGFCLEVGVGVGRDVRAACHWYARAARGGSRQAQLNLALTLREHGHTAHAQRWFWQGPFDRSGLGLFQCGVVFWLCRAVF